VCPTVIYQVVGRRWNIDPWVGEVCISLAAWVKIYYVRRVYTADIACYAAGDARAIPMSGPVVSPRRSRNTTRMTWRDSTTTEIIIIYYIIITILLCSLFAVTLRVLRCSGLINIIWIAHDVVVLHRNCIRKRSRSTELLCFATEELWISLLTIHVCHYMMYQGCVQKIISLADFFLDLRDGYGVHPCEVISLWSEYIVRYF